MAISPDNLNLPHRLILPQICCSCLGPKELMHRVSSFYGADGKSLEAQFDVPMCRACHARMKARERIVFGISLGVLAVSFLIITPLSPIPKALYQEWLAGPNALVFVAAFFALLFVGIGRPFEPARYMQGRFVFRNQEYQSRFEQMNSTSTASQEREKK